ncbi:MAG: VOC family protein [Chloroflexota bacterium]|nr:VOC family protein [Chloroflexota bacterium]
MPLHHVAIAVRDIEESIRFYRDAIGLSIFQDEAISGPDVDASLMVKDGRLRMVVLADEAGNMIELLGWENPSVRERPEEYKNFTSVGLVEVAFMVSDLKQAEDRLSKCGYSFRSPVWSFGSDLEAYGGAHADIRYVIDPNGVQVELMQVVI